MKSRSPESSRKARQNVRTLSRPLGFAAALAAGVVLLSSCSSSGSQSGQGATGDPVVGGTLTYAQSADPVCVDPNQTDLNASRDIVRQVADSLVDADPETGEIKPWLATEWTVNDNATVYDFTLRDDVTFSNGEQFNAEAAKTFLDGINDLGGRAVNADSYLEGYVGTEVIAPNQIRVTFTAPNASFLQALSTVNMAVLAPASYQQTAENRCLGQIVGSGPFVLDHYTPTQEAVINKRAGYNWPGPNAKHTGDAYLDQVVFRVVPEASVRVGSLQSGDVDVINQVPSQNEETLEASGFGLLTDNNPGTVSEYLTNNSGPILKDGNVRKAIQLGVNREEYKSTILLPRNNVATSILSSTTPLYTDFSKYIQYKPDESKKLLDRAGWVPGADGIREKGGQRLTLRLVNGQSGGTAAYELVAQQLADIGVDLQIQNVSRAEMLAALDTGDYDFVPYGFTRADPAALTMHFSSKRNNPLKLQPSELDTYLDEQAASPDVDDRQAAVDKAAEYIVKNNLVIMLAEQSTAHAFDTNKVSGISWEPGVQISLYDTWVQQ